MQQASSSSVVVDGHSRMVEKMNFAGTVLGEATTNSRRSVRFASERFLGIK